MSEELAQFLYAGESLEYTTDIHAGSLGVTSHRLLVHTPHTDGPNLRACHRPNVEDIALTRAGQPERLAHTARFAILGAVLLAGGLLLDLDGLATTVDAPSGAGLGGLLAAMNALVGALTLLDDALLLAGLASLLLALGFLARYASGLQRQLQIRLAGGDALAVPAARTDASVPEQVASVLTAGAGPDSAPSTSEAGRPRLEAE